MKTIYIISAPNKEIENVVSMLKSSVFTVSSFDSVFEFKKHLQTDPPDLVFVADTMKEKKIEDLLKSVKESEQMSGIPVLGLVSTANKKVAATFLKNGAIDAVVSPFDSQEILARIELRIKEMGLRQNFTAHEFFFSEAQEKESGKRTGVFHFYNESNTEVGNVSVEGGRVVHATFGNLIKEDAFLQLSCNDNLKFLFEDKSSIIHKSINEGVTGLLLEASKLKDEMKQQAKDELDETKVLIVDENRIARIMASQVMKKMGFMCKVTSAKEMTVRFMANFAPQLLVIDYHDAEEILDKLWPAKRKNTDIPVIIYCDEDIKDINFDSLGDHDISGTIYKKQFHKDVNALLKKINFI